MHVYIYIYRERERGRERDIDMYSCFIELANCCGFHLNAELNIRVLLVQGATRGVPFLRQTRCVCIYVYTCKVLRILFSTLTHAIRDI